MPDTKLEFGLEPETGILTLGDEVATPDSSRFWSELEWLNIQSLPLAERTAPTSYDKEYVRAWGKKVKTPFSDESGQEIVGIHKLDPMNTEHLSFVHSLLVPQEILQETSDRYMQIFKLLTGKSLPEFQNEVMGIC